MRAAAVDIFQRRGIRGLYAGLNPTLVEIIPYAGIQFGAYDSLKRAMMVSDQQRRLYPKKLARTFEDSGAYQKRRVLEPSRCCRRCLQTLASFES